MKHSAPIRQILLRALSLALALVLTVYGTGAIFAESSAGINNAQRHVVCSELSDAAMAYYTGDYSIEALQALPGAADRSDSYAATQDNPLYDALRELMQSTLRKENLPDYGGFGQNSLAYYWNATDTTPDLDNSKTNHFLLFYSDAVYEYPGNTVLMNREHVWPKSHASFYEMNGGSDLHHLRPTVRTVNEAKADHIFGYVDEVYAAGYETGFLNDEEIYKLFADKDVFEPKDDVKGDVARILLYVYCCWSQPNLYSDVEPSKLPEADPDDKTNTGVRIIADLETLLNWCQDDPVDTWEMQRNDLAEKVQGNRNVFIDYPEFAWKLFGLDVPVGLRTPTQEGCDHIWGEPACESAGCADPGTESRTCSKCGCVRTIPSPAPGHVDEDHNHRCDRCDMMLPSVYTLTQNVFDGDHLLLYHPTAGKAITPEVNSYERLKGVAVTENDGVIVPPDEAAIFCARAAADGGFYLLHDGKYLTTIQKGGKLLWSDIPDDCSAWLFEIAPDGCVYVVNAVAATSYGRSALEYYNNNFTTYSNPNSDAFAFRIFSTSEHAWEKASVVEPTASEPGRITYRCVACGETLTEEIPQPVCTVTYKVVCGTWADGTSEDRTESVVSSASPVDVPTGMLAGEGYTGGAWDTEPASAVINGDAVFTYTFAPCPTYNVVFDSCGGPDVETQTVIEGSNAVKPADPEKEGFTFVGWFLEDAAYAFDVPVNADVTLQARWEENAPASLEPVLITVTVSDGGKWTKGSQTPLHFTFIRPADKDAGVHHLTDIYVDGTVVTETSADGMANYTDVSGNGMVSLQPHLLESLFEGTHTLTVCFDDGNEAAVPFVVKPDVLYAPATGDPAPHLLPLLIMTGSAILFVSIYEWKKRTAGMMKRLK